MDSACIKGATRMADSAICMSMLYQFSDTDITNLTRILDFILLKRIDIGW